MKHVIMTGATGMTGSVVLQNCLHSEAIESVTSIVRRPSGIMHLKLKEVILKDFLDYAGLEGHFENQDIAYFCLGVYTGTVPDAQFREITVDYTIAFADALKSRSPLALFCFLSGSGADQKEQSKISFARYKGMAENYLISKNFGGLFIFRPGYIYPVEKRTEPNFSYRIGRKLYPVIKRLGNKFSIKSTELGAAMFIAGLNPPGKTILDNKDMLQLLQ